MDARTLVGGNGSDSLARGRVMRENIPVVSIRIEPTGSPSMMKRLPLLILVAECLLVPMAMAADNTAPQGFVSLFNGRDLAGWKAPDGDHGHWKVVEGAIDYDAQSEATGEKSLWSDHEYRDFVLQVDWRIKESAIYQ